MKAAILSVDPRLALIDLSHDLPRFGVPEASFVLRERVGRFPPGMVHVAVVDPGVGGHRAPIALRCSDGSWFVGPDNGLLRPAADRRVVVAAFRLDRARLAESTPPSQTFEGRDVFAPAAARIALGEPITRFAGPWTPEGSPLPVPVLGAASARGEVVHVDRFGNLFTNLPVEWLPAPGRTVLAVIGRSSARRCPVVPTYEHLSPNGVGLLASSSAFIEIAARERSAAERLRARTGTPVVLRRANVDATPDKRVNSAGRKR